MRTADVYSPEVVWERSVSHEWVRAAYALATFKRQDPPTVKTLNELRRAVEASNAKTTVVQTVERLSNATPEGTDTQKIHGEVKESPAPAANLSNPRGGPHEVYPLRPGHPPRTSGQPRGHAPFHRKTRAGLGGDGMSGICVNGCGPVEVYFDDNGGPWCPKCNGEAN